LITIIVIIIIIITGVVIGVFFCRIFGFGIIITLLGLGARTRWHRWGDISERAFQGCGHYWLDFSGAKKKK
jgi:predicted membrane protein